MALDMRFDNRIVERNISRGIVTREEYEAHLASLTDASENAEAIDVAQPLVSIPEEEAAGEEGSE